MKHTLTVPILSRGDPTRLHPAGTEVRIVESLPGVHIIEIRVADPTLEGGAWWDVIEVLPEEVRSVPDDNDKERS